MGFSICLERKCSHTFKYAPLFALRAASTDAAEREQRGLAHYAEPRGGNTTLVVG
ncbi:MAG: hypothetical protein J6Q45_01100 [Alistipes sp.]|nr:hypothetical protein [Alistipes sp.]